MTAAAVPAARREIEAITLVGFAHGVSHFFHLVIPPVFPWLMPEFNLSFTQAGAMMAVFFTVSGVGQVLAGFAVDRFGARRVLLGGIALLGVSAVILGLAPSYSVLLLAAAVAGVGNCVFHPADFTLLNRNVTGRRLGHAFSVHGLSGNLGWALAPVFMTGIAIATDWRTAAFAASGVAVAAFLPLWLRREAITEGHGRPAPATSEPKTSTFAFLGSVPVWMCFAFLFLITASGSALQNFGPSALHEVYGMSLAAGASALTALMLGGAAGTAAGGFLAKYEHLERQVAAMLAGAALCAVILASDIIPAWSVPALMALMGFCTGLAGPSRDMLIRRAATAQFGQLSFGRVYGFVYSGLDVGFALAPVVLFGPLMDSGQFARVLLGVALLQGLAIFTALSVGRGVALRTAAARP